jgi:CHAT domain-containing protein
MLSDFVISSYTPTLSALLNADSLAPTTHSRLLAIGQEATPGYSRLPGTKAELLSIKSHIQPPLHYIQMTDRDATTDKVLAAMEECDWVHLACHASQNIQDPTKSGFFLHDGMLSLATIMQKSLEGKGLAFLSACQTAAGDEERPNEAVHLASGMLLAGYPSVIATMWSVKDRDAPVIADKVYDQLLKSGKMDYKEAAKALHVAIGELRAKVGVKEFGRWVPYVHIGV